MEHIGIAHFSLHILTIAVSLLLFLLAARAYFRERGKRLALVSFAFALFLIQQILTLVDLLYLAHRLMVPLHVLSFIVVLLFFFGLMHHD